MQMWTDARWTARECTVVKGGPAVVTEGKQGGKSKLGRSSPPAPARAPAGSPHLGAYLLVHRVALIGPIQTPPARERGRNRGGSTPHFVSQ